MLADPEVEELCDKCSSIASVDLRHLLINADDERAAASHRMPNPRFASPASA